MSSDAEREVDRAVITCRPARADDLRPVTVLHVMAWQHAYQGIVPQSHLDSLDVEEAIARRAEHWPWPGSQVAELDGVIAGWTSVGPYRGEGCPPGSGEVYAIYVHPEYWSAGVGRSLLHSGMNLLAAQQLSPVFLWVLAGNARARRFYERAGFVPDGAEEGFEAGGAIVPEVRYRHPGVPDPIGATS